MLVHILKFFVLRGFLLGNQTGPSFDLNTTKIIFYYGSTTSENQTYDLDSIASVLQHPKFIHNHTTLYMNGYNQTQNGNNMNIMIDSYYKANSTNFLSVSWQAITNGPYLAAEVNLLRVAPRLADAILALFDAGLDQDSFDLVGLSLGAHGAGRVAHEVIQRSQGNVTLNRVTYLEPSNPEIHIFILPLLTKDVARFVQAIHTDAGGRGTARKVGHADFWPNGGTIIQPGCPSLSVNYLCSHLKSGAYFGQSVANVHPEQLIAYPALDYEDFLENKEVLMNTTGVPMGVNCPPSARGNYYLEIANEYGQIPVVGLDI